MALATSVVMMDRGNNTTCTINLHGATVVSWRVNNQEQLFVSKSAVFDGKRPIRGGIPIVFPQFGAWAFGPQHGFARNITWTVEKPPEKLQSGDVEVIFSLMDNEYTRCMWNYPFRLTYRLILREKELHFNIGVYNPSNDLAFNFNLLLHTYLKVPDVRRCQVNGLYGCHYIDKVRQRFYNFNLLLHTYLKVPDVRRCQVNGLYGCHYIDKVRQRFYNFNLLLHTYLKVPDVRRCQVNGLYGCHYIDKVLDNQLFRETRETVSVSSLTDRIYQNTCQEHVVTNVVSGRKMRLQKYNFPDTVIWNPWDTGRDMKDFGDDEYPNMICVEAGHVTSPVLLHPGTTFEASQILQVM
ncbi:hypothetical protein M8J76_006474 [Diaphorina citri]|nr:hypothetical protein M8J75_006687 [Diaphorina citri]KAI5708930.1 hypothetical protein M8J76_006474 [Diaphorina citri]